MRLPFERQAEAVPEQNELQGAEGDHLQDRLPLGQQGDRQFDLAGDRLAQGGDGELAEQDQAAGDGDLRQGAPGQDAEDGARDQNLVGDRIEDGAPAGRRMPPARQEAVDPVGRGRDHEDDEGRPPEPELVIRAQVFGHERNALRRRPRQDQEHDHPGDQSQAGQDVRDGIGVGIGGHGALRYLKRDLPRFAP